MKAARASPSDAPVCDDEQPASGGQDQGRRPIGRDRRPRRLVGAGYGAGRLYGCCRCDLWTAESVRRCRDLFAVKTSRITAEDRVDWRIKPNNSSSSAGTTMLAAILMAPVGWWIVGLCLVSNTTLRWDRPSNVSGRFSSSWPRRWQDSRDGFFLQSLKAQSGIHALSGRLLPSLYLWLSLVAHSVPPVSPQRERWPVCTSLWGPCSSWG